MKVKIFTPYGARRPKKKSHPGNRMEPHYVEKVDEHGHRYLEKDGETDTYEIIQSHKEEADVHNILARYAAGDMGVLKPRGLYIDATQLPSSMAEMLNLMRDQREKFDQLPVEIKKQFENSFDVWAATAGTEDWAKKMGYSKEKAEAAEQPEVKAE